MYPFLDLTEFDTGTSLMLRLDSVTSLREHEEGGTHIWLGTQEHWVKESLEEIRAAIATLSIRFGSSNFWHQSAGMFAGSGISRVNNG
jgi:hypothetical protein